MTWWKKIIVQDSNRYCDSIILEISQLDLILVNIYPPPNCQKDLFRQTLELISVHLRNMESHNKHSKHILIHGDFNFPFLSFDGSNITITGKYSNLDKIQAEGLIQLANAFSWIST